jgi:benzoylformate decarboxylase
MVGSIDLALQALLLHPAGAPRRDSAQREPVARVRGGKPLSTAFVLQTLDELRAADDVFVEEAPGARGLLQQHLPMAGADSFYTMASGGLGSGCRRRSAWRWRDAASGCRGGSWR